MYQIPLIKDVVTLTNGFFQHIAYDFPDFINKSYLDIQFYTEFGQRTIAPLVNSFFLVEGVSQLTDEQLDTIGFILLQMYSHKWSKQLAVLDYEYNPIANYSDIYSEEYSKESSDTKEDKLSGSDTTTRTDNLSKLESLGTSSDSTRTDNLQKQETRALNNSANSNSSGNVFGFNSNLAVPDSTASETRTGTDTGTVTYKNTGTQTNKLTNSGSNTTTNTGTQTNELSHDTSRNINDSFNESGKRDYTRTGNIGNILTQDMIQSEIDLWRWNFINEILNDVKEALTIPYYINFTTK